MEGGYAFRGREVLPLERGSVVEGGVCIWREREGLHLEGEGFCLWREDLLLEGGSAFRGRWSASEGSASKGGGVDPQIYMGYGQQADGTHLTGMLSCNDFRFTASCPVAQLVKYTHHVSYRSTCFQQ